jgi:hypothetical protein
MIDWRLRILSEDEADALRTLISRLIAGSSIEEHQPDYDRYAAVMTVVDLGLPKNEEEKRRTQLEKYVPLANMRAKIQATLLLQFVLQCRYAGALLMKEPVFDTSHSYKEVEYNRRTYSDLREELVTKMVSLPPYQAIVHLASQSGELPVQILTPSPLPISPDAEPKANLVREESRHLLGHPWQEVVKDIQTRQNLPPAKPQI